MSNFDKVMEFVMRNEGGYVLHEVEHDTGGRTFAGIAENFWADWEGWDYIDGGNNTSYTNPKMRELVNGFYKKNFWNPLRLDGIDDFDIAYTIYDFGVNGGIKTSARLAQKVAGVVEDGKIGPKSLEAINTMDSKYFQAMFAVYKLDRYLRIIGNNHSQAKFAKGWANRTLSVLFTTS